MAYFANGSEGERLEMQCNRCPLGHGACPVYGVQENHNYDQCDNPQLREAMDLLVCDKDGVCEMREQLVTLGLAKTSARG